VHAHRDSPWTRKRGRRDVLKLGAVIAAGGVAAPLLAACATPSRTGTVSVAPNAGDSGARSTGSGAGALSGPITVLTEGIDPSAEPSLQKVYDDFKGRNPAIDWDIRAIPGLGPEWDRLARSALESGEPIGLVMLDGLFVRAWTRDGLLADLGSDPRLAEVLARVPDRFHLGGLGGDHPGVPARADEGRPDDGAHYNNALLDRAGLEPPKTIADLKAMVKPLAALGAARWSIPPVTRRSIPCSSCGCCR
jgi:ABC-type glycerol-3-phosphate transport system substrate-binding protein